MVIRVAVCVALVGTAAARAAAPTVVGSAITCPGCVDNSALASSYSGVGNCAAGEYVSGLGEDVPPSCSLPDTLIQTTQTTPPAAPGAGKTVTYALEKGAPRLGLQTPSERFRAFDVVMESGLACILPQDAANLTEWGMGSTVYGTTLSTPALAAGAFYAAANRSRFGSIASAGVQGGIRGSGGVTLGDGAGRGGFRFVARACVINSTAGHRRSWGLGPAANAGNVEPSAILNTIYLGANAADTNFSVCSNDGAGSATCVDLGASFPAKQAAACYDVIFAADPNGSTVNYYIDPISAGGAAATGTISSDLPANTVFLYPHLWAGTAASSTATVDEMFRMCIDAQF